MRLQAAGFFSPRPGGLGLNEDEDIILNCYWLAQWYHQNPEVFLSMPISQVQIHMMRTQRIAEIRREYSAAQSDDGN